MTTITEYVRYAFTHPGSDELFVCILVTFFGTLGLAGLVGWTLDHFDLV